METEQISDDGNKERSHPDKSENQLAHRNQYEELHDEYDLRCGYRGCRPVTIQVLNNSYCLLFLLSAFAFIQGMVVNGINSVNTSSYERRFGFSSSQVGLISSAYDISAGILVLPISYYGIRGHKTVMLAISVGTMAIGSFLMLIPHFTTPPYEWGQFVSTLCITAGNTSQCAEPEAYMTNYLYVFIAGQLLHGVGGTTLLSVGICCLDDNVTSKRSPIYVGILFAFATLGPAAGYMLGGYFLTIYVDFHILEDDIPLETTDPRWVGAWWIGFLISMVLSFALIFPLLGFPKELPGAEAARATRVSEAHRGGRDVRVHMSTSIGSFKDFHAVLWLIVKNPAFLFISLANGFHGLMNGFIIFIPKFIQNQYAQTASSAGFMAGLMAVPGGVAGHLLGGYICQRYNLKVRGMLIFCAITCVVCSMPAMGFWAKCETVKIAGVNTMYNNKELPIEAANLTSECNDECGCTLENYSPVCGADGIQYFSSCHAGCRESKGETYHTCSCVSETFSGHNESHSAESGTCEASCHLMMFIFLGMFLLAILLTMLISTPATIATLRCVPEVHKTFALGVQSVFLRFIGTVPGPILVGAAIDNACVVWRESCADGKDGEKTSTSCWIYDNDAMALNLFLLFAGVKLISALLYFAANLFYKAPDKDETESLKLEEVANGRTADHLLESTKLSTGSGLYPRISGLENGYKYGTDNPALVNPD